MKASQAAENIKSIKIVLTQRIISSSDINMDYDQDSSQHSS